MFYHEAKMMVAAEVMDFSVWKLFSLYIHVFDEYLSQFYCKVSVSFIKYIEK
jgi:hypothetical protein